MLKMNKKQIVFALDDIMLDFSPSHLEVTYGWRSVLNVLDINHLLGTIHKTALETYCPENMNYFLRKKRNCLDNEDWSSFVVWILAQHVNEEIDP